MSDEETIEKKQKLMAERWVKPNEDKQTWCSRTGMEPNFYTQYGGVKEVKEKKPMGRPKKYTGIPIIG